MRRYIFKRLLQLIPMILAITFVSFAVMYGAAGDAVDILYDKSGGASELIKSQKRAILGLDQPFFVQYFNWLQGFLQGDMGHSYISGQPVFSSFMSRLPATFQLMFSAMSITIVFSVPLGVLAALRRDSWLDYIIRLVSFLGNSLPGFLIALLLIYLFALQLSWLPVLANGGGWLALILPSLSLAISMSARYTRQIRATVLEELGRDYVVGARARGIPEWRIIYASVLKVTLLTMVTLLALSVGSLLGGTAIIETIFMWDGVGKLAVDSIVMRDYPMIQAYVIWMSIIYIVVNLVVDIIYHYLDPRIRIDSEE